MTWEAKEATTGTELHLRDFSLSGISLGLPLWVYRKQGLEVAARGSGRGQSIQLRADRPTAEQRGRCSRTRRPDDPVKLHRWQGQPNPSEAGAVNTLIRCAGGAELTRIGRFVRILAAGTVVMLIAGCARQDPSPDPQPQTWTPWASSSAATSRGN